jgi:hypothetical protein
MVHLDNEMICDNDSVDQSGFDWESQINFGYSKDVDGGEKLFTGSIKNFTYKQIAATVDFN